MLLAVDLMPSLALMEPMSNDDCNSAQLKLVLDCVKAMEEDNPDNALSFWTENSTDDFRYCLLPQSFAILKKPSEEAWSKARYFAYMRKAMTLIKNVKVRTICDTSYILVLLKLL